MTDILDYKIIETLYEGNNSKVYYATRGNNKKSVVLKVMANEYPTPEEIARFQLEYKIISNLKNIEGVIKADDLKNYRNRLVIVLEDFGGISLERILVSKLFSIKEFLKFAVTLVEIIGDIHKQGIVHKDINPSNILLNQETNQVKVIDFGISTILAEESPEIWSINILQGTLPYISPEQTGRMNRALDYRSDYYSLGVTLYKILTKKLPFDTDDAIEMVHCHLSREPIPPHKINPEIPETLSEIIMKLMSKMAEDRYQSSYGIKSDLQKCLDNLKKSGKIFRFELGKDDIFERFKIPQKLYGREDERKILLDAFKEISKGEIKIILVSGYAGIGKSVLVNEIQKPITLKCGYYISGKFDQYKRNIPYFSKIQAFKELIKQILSETDGQIAVWRKKILEAVGPNGRVITEVIPEVELIIGKQPHIPKLQPTEAQNRFKLVFQNFVKSISDKNHPLVIFLDDLQWVDYSSLNMIESFLTGLDIGYLLIIGAYRDNEVDESHPLSVALARMVKKKIDIKRIGLKPLNLNCVNRLLSDTLKCERQKSEKLAELCHSKTNGNPFFLKQFLYSLQEKKLIEFNYKNGIWEWNLEKIKKAQITDNVVDLMTQKIQELPEMTNNVLKLAACIGNMFDLKTLSLINEKSIKKTSEELFIALKAGLVLPMDESYRLVEHLNNLNINYKFLHDRIQQAAYLLINETDRKKTHLKIGRLILENTAKNELEDRIFDIITQLNEAKEFIDNQSEIDRLAELNLVAGTKAKSSGAKESAYTYLKFGLDLLGKNGWERQYQLCLDLHSETAEAAYLNGDYDEVERLFDEVISHSKDVLDKAKVYDIKIQAYMAQNMHQNAITTGLEITALLGIKLPKNPGKLHILIELMILKIALAGKKTKDLVNLPEMTDPYIKALQNIACSIAPAAYFANTDLLAVMILKAIRIFLKYGISPFFAFALSGYGFILCGFFDDVKRGYEAGQLSIKILERIEAKDLWAKTILSYHVFSHRKDHMRASWKPLSDAYQIGLEVGDLEYACLCKINYLTFVFESGKNLGELEKEMQEAIRVIAKYNQETPLYATKIFRQTILNLRGNNENPYLLTSKSFDERTMMSSQIEANNLTILNHIYMSKLKLSFLFYQYSNAIENIEGVKKSISGVIGGINILYFHFYSALTYLAIFPKLSKKEKMFAMKKIAKTLKITKKWAKDAPMNYLHKYNLVEAEKARILNKDNLAMQYYDKAIELAKENLYIHDEALANELAGKFYLSRKREKIAKVYLNEARYCYVRWGATAKVKHLEETYSDLIESEEKKITTKKETTTTTISSTYSAIGGHLDLLSFIKASQAISGEIVLENLLSKMMKIVTENAGAQNGYFLLKRNDNWCIEAESSIEHQEIKILQSVPIQSVDESSLSPKIDNIIVHFVARALEPVVLNDAFNEGNFRNDSYIVKVKPKSVLCLPLINQGRLIGILYFENNLITGAFTPSRIEVLKLLASQIAISIENARIYYQLDELNRNLEQKVEARTKELNEAYKELNKTYKIIKTDLMLAKRIQENILPSNIKRIKNLNFFIRYFPMSEVGGDIYDMIEFFPDVIRLFLSDATGHGVQAALVTMLIKGIYEPLKNVVNSPSEIFEIMNLEILTNYKTLDQFFTAIIIDINLKTGKITYASAGHPTQFVITRNKLIELPSTGKMAGVFPDVLYSDIELDFNKGDKIFLFTDGLFEEFNINQEEFGEERVKRTLFKYLDVNPDLSINNLMDSLYNEIESFLGKEEKNDDITMIGIEYFTDLGSN